MRSLMGVLGALLALGAVPGALFMVPALAEPSDAEAETEDAEAGEAQDGDAEDGDEGGGGDATGALRGTLTDPEDEPVSGVEIVAVDTDAGEEVGTATTDEDGSWRLDLPGPGQYEVALQEDTLPEDLALTDPDRAELEVSVRSGQQRTLIFPLGERESTAAAMFGRVAQNLATGVKFGLIVAITSVGLSLVFGTTRLINFSHGEMVSFGAIVAWFLNRTGPELHMLIAGPLAVVAGGLLGAVLDRGLWRPLRARQAGIIQMLVISVGLALVIRHVLLFFYGGGSNAYANYAVQEALRFGPVAMTPRDLAIMGLSTLVLVVVGLALVMSRTGKAMRAVADNRDLAESSGINVQRIILLIWVAGGALTALGGVFLGLMETVNYFMGFRLLLLMFSGVILGGLGTAFGAMAGGLVVGMVVELSTLYFSPELKEMWALVVLILILLARPQGILGVRERVG